MIIMSIGRGGDASDGIRLDMMHRNVALHHSRYSNRDHSLDHRHNWNDSLDHRSSNGHMLHSHNRRGGMKQDMMLLYITRSSCSKGSQTKEDHNKLQEKK